LFRFQTMFSGVGSLTSGSGVRVDGADSRASASHRSLAPLLAHAPRLQRGSQAVLTWHRTRR
jgi:hypothetical protein